MTCDCEQAGAEHTCSWFDATDEVYVEIVSAFRKTNYLLQQIPDTVPFGVFLLDTRLEQIVYADKNFMAMNGINKRLLKRAAIRRFVFSSMHPDDWRRFDTLYRNVGKKGHPSYVNCALRFKHALSYQSYYFIMKQPEFEGSVCANYLVGMQINQSPLKNKIPDEQRKIECYEQLISVMV
ncbi:hypothetical protein J1N10_15715 [Carboxylicivirga sp. A043]|uniref:hypothetical protein n=1 Tax=Carboxylicivirga litoralis TaxID=2816963 RepID=UPI0021CB0501|nr:hypothetical protein [Carboxylicivirga sp. A043]MCU4157424.1 hypothetical protein [Carboxylicivirga sp. A043]